MDCQCATNTSVNNCIHINNKLSNNGLFGDAKREVHSNQNSTWRISPEPFWIDNATYKQLNSLGRHLLAFYQGTQRLYELSLQGKQPQWVKEYLELGKTEQIIDYGKMRRFKKDIPIIIRPDILLTEDGLKASELDAIPGGFGLLAALTSGYSDLNFEMIGGSNGIIKHFAQSLQNLTTKSQPNLAIIVSEESSDYWDEMAWLSKALTDHGLQTITIKPEDIIFKEEGLFYSNGNKQIKIDIVYRFFELFDLKNIPKIDLILYAIRKQLVVVTPPLKSFLEEKLSFALLHHPTLTNFWKSQLGNDTFAILKNIFPETWVLDPRPLPPHAIIPGFSLDEQAVNNWEILKSASKRQRQLVVKESGFSENAWGSRSVSIGHDMSSANWSDSLDNALSNFSNSPYVIQKFYKGKKVSTSYYDFETQEVKNMNGRIRLCPYYFVYNNEEVKLAGILSTICPLDKKLIHGMVDAVMTPTAVY